MRAESKVMQKKKRQKHKQVNAEFLGLSGACCSILTGLNVLLFSIQAEQREQLFLL